jgi:peptide methionine sulfoxide reductase MsrA
MHSPTYPQKTQYRSAIFYNSGAQRSAALKKIEQLEMRLDNVFTAVEPVSAFYRAEEYHQDFLNKQRTGAGRWAR